jgi:hypothetical protein
MLRYSGTTGLSSFADLSLVDCSPLNIFPRVVCLGILLKFFDISTARSRLMECSTTTVTTDLHLSRQLVHYLDLSSRLLLPRLLTRSFL